MKALLLFLAFFSFSVRAEENPILSSYRLDNPNLPTLELVNRFYGIEHRDGNSFEIIVPQEESSFFLTLAPFAELVSLDVSRDNQERISEFASGYRSFEEIKAWMRNLEATKDFAKVIQYGESGGGRELLALRIRTGDEKKPIIMITAATHGDELITTEVLVQLVDQMVAGFDTNPRFQKMIQEHDLYFIPVVNPDGFVMTRRFEGRFDPNRSYPWPGNLDASPTPSIEAIMQLAGILRPVASIDFHAYGEMIMYPWAYTKEPVSSPHKEKFHSITAHMAAANNYVFGPISKVIYVAPGSSADYYYWKTGSFSLGIEIGKNKIPNPSEFPRYVQSQAESTWRFIESF